VTFYMIISSNSDKNAALKVTGHTELYVNTAMKLSVVERLD